MEVLREQGLNPYLWLEYTTEGYSTEYGWVSYFDGFVSVERYSAFLKSKDPLVFIRILDIEHFDAYSLNLLRSFNAARYKDKQRLVGISKRPTYSMEYLKKNYFKVYGELLEQGNNDFAKALILERDSITYDSEVIPYQEAMDNLYTNINKETSTRVDTYKETKGGIYYSYKKYLAEACELPQRPCFVPDKFTTYTKKESNPVGWVDDGGFSSTCIEQENTILKMETRVREYLFWEDTHYGLYAYFKDSLPALGSYIEELQLKDTAAQLAGLDGAGYTHGISIVSPTPYQYKDLSNTVGVSNQVIYQIPDVGNIIISNTNIDYEGYKAEKKSSFEDAANPLVLSKFVYITPLFCSSIEFKDNYFDIQVQCIVGVGGSGKVFLDIPLWFVMMHGAIIEGSVLMVPCQGGCIRFMHALLPYVKKDYDLEEVLGEKLVSYSIKNRKYKRMHE